MGKKPQQKERRRSGVEPDAPLAQGRNGAAAQLDNSTSLKKLGLDWSAVKPHETIVVDRLESEDGKTKGTAEMFRRLGVSGKALVIDVKPGEKFTQSARNIEGLHLVAASRVTARDIMDTAHVIATREALVKLQEALA